MPIQAVCPECRTVYRLADNVAGKQVRCKQCQAVFVAGAAARPKAEPPQREVRVVVERPAARPAAPAPAPRRPAGRDRDYDRDRDDTPRRAAAARPAANHLPWIVGGAVACTLLLVVGIVIVALIVRSDGKQKNAEVAAASATPAAAPAPAQAAPPPVVPAAPPLAAKLPALPPAAVEPPDEAPSLRKADAALSGGGGGERRLTAAARDKVKHATVFLRVVFADGNRASGTGFFGAPGAGNLILTNAHVVGMLAPESRRPRDVEAVLNSGERDERHVKARVLGVDRHSDLAVLDVGTAEGMPTPLTVRPAKNLQELDQVYVFGFPLGEQLGKEITIRPSSVSSLRKRNGILEKVQVNGGMDPGNSGGPVVDNAGDVVGVAVSGFEGRQINFAIPGERVQTILDGRLSALGTGQPYLADGGKVGVPVTMEMIDPRRRITEAGLHVWTGDRGPNLPPGEAAPTRPGDSPHERTRLTYADGTARADLLLPQLPAGKVYWVQPYYVTAGSTHYVSGHVYEPKGQPVERKPARLSVQHKPGNRELNLTTRNTFRVGQEDDDGLAATMRTTVALQEETSVSGGGAAVKVRYKSADREITVNKERKQSDLLNEVRPYLNRLVGVLRVDGNGNLTQNGVDERLLAALAGGGSVPRVPGTVRAPRTPSGARMPRPPVVTRPPAGGNNAGNNTELVEKLLYFHEPTRHGLEALAVPLPNQDGVAPGFTWSAKRSLPIDTPMSYESGQLEMTYTYLGQRVRNGKAEAVIQLEGVVQPKDGKENLSGKVTGTALVDLTTGVVTQAETRAVLDIEAEVFKSGKTVKLLATLESKLERP
jgi:predicted Zn finger-like uncharacterized protein